MGKILYALCNWKKIWIIEAKVCPDHVHMLVGIPPKVAISGFMRYLKGKNSRMIYEKYPELRYKYRNRGVCCPGYYADYSREECEEDKGWRTVDDGKLLNPFMGSK